MTNWRSYDSIAGRYDVVWGTVFEAVARHMWARIPPVAGATVLDIGTGTGIVPRCVAARGDPLAAVFGCDRSAGMLSLAKKAMPILQVLVADATQLPFRHSNFEIVTASFVLSHLVNYGAALLEAYRVLRPAGTLVVTSWTANADPYSQAWSELLSEAVSKEWLQEGVAQVAPSEAYFEKGENVKTALTAAGFAGVEVHTIELKRSLSIDSYIADREISSGGRLAQDLLGPDGWRRFAAIAREELQRSFGSHFEYSRGALMGVAHRK